MYCKNCGKQLDDSAVICPGCGCATDNFYKNGYAEQAQQNTANKSANIFAIISLVLGIIGLWLGVLFCIIPALGIIFGIVGLKKSDKTGTGRGVATGGLVTSIISFCLWAMFFIVILLTV